MSAEVDAAIAAAWPDQWTRANNPAFRNRSKARNNLRKAWAGHLAYQAFVAANPQARCGNCAHRSAMPHSIPSQPTCDLDSDFHGYSLVKLDHVCTRWEATSALSRNAHRAP